MATSYINEHTAEYYLVPALKKLLESEFRRVAPVFPWLSRELSKVSREIHGKDLFHVLIMFPRRPKVTIESEKTIYVTINRELECFSEVCDQYRVPVIAGCPNASDFWDLSRENSAIWLDVRHSKLKRYLDSAADSSARLREADVVHLARHSALLDMDGFEKLVRDARAHQPHRIYGPQYKPVYFLLKNDDQVRA